MTITRKQLYEQVWAEPMIKVAVRFGVSANYLARVCEHLNVPHPPRGYWAKLKVGNAPKQPALPISRLAARGTSGVFTHTRSNRPPSVEVGPSTRWDRRSE
jgi:hypothetical protein